MKIGGNWESPLETLQLRREKSFLLPQSSKKKNVEKESKEVMSPSRVREEKKRDVKVASSSRERSKRRQAQLRKDLRTRRPPNGAVGVTG